MLRRAFLAFAAAALAAPPVRRARAADDGDAFAFAFAFDSIDGGRLPLSEFRGRALLVVNTASRCGFTYQYEALQSLWSRYRDRGLTVIGVPSDDFRQELSSEEAVKDFCETNFAIDFPMTSITPVRGPQAHPFFAWAGEKLGPPRWNFHKYLVGPDGRLRAAFGTGDEPTSRKVLAAIEAALPSA